MMLRRLSVLGSLLLAACVPTQVPELQPAGYYNKVTTRAERADWRATRRADTAQAYRAFINKYPKSRYVPAAIERLKVVVKKKPPTVRRIKESGSGGGAAGGGRSY